MGSLSETDLLTRQRALHFVFAPYMRSFVVARINPLRWIQVDLPPAEKVLTTMRDRAAKFNAEKVRQEDLTRMGGGVPDEES
jgi:ParB family chromosome partitioning protein